MSLVGTDGLRLDQAPPLAIPASFFLLAPVALVGAGVLLASEPIGSGWAPRTVALTHLGTLGLLGSVMIGALYQMLPVVVGVPVPAVRLAHVVHAAWVAGVGGLVGGLLLGSALAVAAGGVCLTVALLLFLVPIGVALARAPLVTPTVTGMRLAVGALVLLAVVGLRLAYGHAGGALPADRATWLQVHLGLGLTGWVGALIAAVSWQVVPMFYLAPTPSRPGVLPALVLGLVSPLLALAGVSPLPAQVPAAVAVWGIVPLATLHALSARKRKLADASLRFWQLGMTAAPLVLLAAAWARFGDDPRGPLLFGWLALWGWGGAVVHGMLTRIVPFLVWFHRYSPLLGRAPVPPMRQLWPDKQVRVGWWLHGATLLAGVFDLQRFAGLGLALTGLWLLGGLLRALSSHPAR